MTIEIRTIEDAEKIATCMKSPDCTLQTEAAFFNKYCNLSSPSYVSTLRSSLFAHLTPDAKKFFAELFAPEEKEEPKEEPKEEVTYEIGQTFIFNPTGEIFILATHRGRLATKEINSCKKDVSLIAIKSKNKGACFCRLYPGASEPISFHVKNFNKITKEEFEKICDGMTENFTLIQPNEVNHDQI